MEAPALQEDALPQHFQDLYVTKVLEKLCTSNKTPHDAATELRKAVQKLHELQQEFVAKQAKHNLLDRLAQVENLEEEKKATAVRKVQVETGLEHEKGELQSAVQERNDALRLLEKRIDEVEREKKLVLEHERTRDAHESELAQLNAMWKEIQTKNAHRKVAVQVATGFMITDEEDCNRVLDQQVQIIHEMNQKQKLLEDQKIDISTQVKRTKRKVEKLSKQNDLTSKDAKVKQREQDYMTMQQMKKWYDHMRGIQESLSGLEITMITDDYVEVRVLKSHLVRLFCNPETTKLQRVELLTSEPASSDLVDVAVRDNIIQYLLFEYRERVRKHLSL